MAIWIVTLIVAGLCAATPSASAQCCGDCDGNGVVTIEELVGAVNYALDGCASALQPVISLRGVTLSTTAAVLSEEITEGRVELEIETDWAGDDQNDRVLFVASTPFTFADRVHLVRTGRFLRWIVTETSGREVDLSVDTGAWQPGNHTVTAGWGAGTMHLGVDGALARESDVGAVSIAAGADVQIGAPGSTGTTFRTVLFLARAR